MPVDAAIARTRSLIRAFDEMLETLESAVEVNTPDLPHTAPNTRASHATQAANPATLSSQTKTEPASDHRSTDSPRAAA